MIRVIHLSVLFFIVLLASNPSYSQNVSSSLKKANALYKKEQYRNALPFYEEVLAAEPENTEALFKSGICYLNRFSKEKALENIVKAYEKDSTVSKHIRYWMGRAYQSNYEFEKAAESYNIYKNSLRKKDQRSDELRIHLEQNATALDLVKSPKDFVVQNLGENINSSFSDHSPVISQDGKNLYFTSRRMHDGKEKEELDGEPFEDIYISKKEDSTSPWSKPESIQLINTTGHDATCQLYDNDTKMVIYKFYKGGDIYVSEKDGGKWGEPKPLAKNINTKKFESSAFVTNDGNTIYFSSNRYKKNDDLDIYYITKESNGDWSKIKELKGNINTKFDEDAPFITPDGKTMYFSSRGHKNMGGFDVFKSTVDENGNWSTPENLGFPINTPDDDIYYYLSSNGRRGYLSSYRSGGYGEKDIYEIIPIAGVRVQGLVTEDVTGEKIDGLTVSFVSQKNTTAPSAATDRSKDGGQYGVKVTSHNTYKIAVLKGADTLKTELFDLPVSDEENKIFTKNIVLPYTAKDTPSVKPPVTTTPGTGPAHRYVFRKTYFADGKATLTDEAKHELDIAAEILKKNPDAVITVTGYDKNSTKLAQDRAKAVSSYLTSKGVNASRINDNKGVISKANNLNSRSAELDVKLKSGLAMNFDPKVIPAYAVGTTFVLRNVYFVTAKHELKPEGRAELDTLTSILKDNPTLKIELAGHTDDVGNEAYNQKLSESRAKEVVNYLIKQGISADRLTYKGYGESTPYVPNTTPFNRQLNRRTEAKIIAR
jgi:outer membrane protein OmpA-like peptidoglycan-associated protein/tetratricopeptide (TPR) repeat protein